MIEVRGPEGPRAALISDPTLMPATMTVRYPKGVIAVRPCMPVGEHLAVIQHTKLGRDDRPMTAPGWRIAVRLRGLALLGMFDRRSQAVRAAAEIDGLLDWDAYACWRLNGGGPERFEQVRGAYFAIVTRCGGRAVDPAVVLASAEDLRRVQHEMKGDVNGHQ